MNKNYKEIDLMYGNTIENSVNELLDYREKGMLVYGTFNSHKLYSDTVTMDSAYKEITGKTKSEFDDYIKRRNEEYKRQEQDHKKQIPLLSKTWMEKGREVLSQDKWEFWDRIVPIRLNDLYQGMELGQCLDIIKLLNDGGSFEDAKDLIDNQGHSGMSFGLICSMLKEFSPVGEEFVTYVR